MCSDAALHHQQAEAVPGIPPRCGPKKKSKRARLVFQRMPIAFVRDREDDLFRAGRYPAPHRCAFGEYLQALPSRFVRMWSQEMRIERNIAFSLGEIPLDEVTRVIRRLHLNRSVCGRSRHFDRQRAGSAFAFSLWPTSCKSSDQREMLGRCGRPLLPQTDR